MLVFLALEGLVSLRSSTTSGSYILILLLSPPLQCSLSPDKKDFFMETRWSLFQGLSFSAHCPMVYLCICSHVLLEEIYLTMIEKGIDLWIEQCHWIICAVFVSRMVISSFPLGLRLIFLFLTNWAVLGIGYFSWNLIRFKSNPMLFGCFYKLCAKESCRQIIIVDQRVFSCAVPSVP